MPESMVEPIVTEMECKLWVILKTSPSVHSTIVPFMSFDPYQLPGTKWQNKPALAEGTRTSGASAASYGDKLFLVGGIDKLCRQYDTSCDQWSNIEKQPKRTHDGGLSIVHKNKILLLGGYEVRKWSTDVEEFNKEDWSTVSAAGAQCNLPALPIGQIEYQKALLFKVREFLM